MNIEEQLKAGIAAAKAKDIPKASKLLIEVVRSEPKSELGWLWLGFCCTTPKQRETCFLRVLAINPQNSEAKHQLELLRGQTIRSQSIDPDRAALLESHKNGMPVSQEPPISQPAREEMDPRSRKKNDKAWIGVGVGLGLFFVIAFAGIFILGRMTNHNNTLSNGNQTSTLAPTAIEAIPTISYQPVFQAAPCDFQPPEQAGVDCGYVIVPEDRKGDPTDTIRIAVAIYHSTSTDPKPEPILYLQGGPGDEAIRWSLQVYASVIAPLLSERDFIVFDPRGAGRSEPVLDCDEFGKTYLQDLQGKIPADQKVSYYQGALLSCKNNLVKQGVNLSAYTSVNMAADAKDVLVALGYQQANLYGISYGTRVAQFVMRDHPESVRSAILDSVVPVEIQLLNQGSTKREDILPVLFEDCKSDPVCSSAYPDLENVYNQVFNQLNAQPVQVTVPVAEDRNLEESIDGYTFQNAVMWALRTSETIPLAPQLIYRVRDGDLSTLKLSLALPIVAFDSISMGSYISVNCHDQVFAMPMQSLDRTIYDMCGLWDIDPPVSGENDPVNSESPTLIFAGRYDATTPPSFAHQLAGHLPHSYIAEILDQGHAPSATGLSDCPTKLISMFLQDPNTAPDFTCIKETQVRKFVVPYDGTAPLVLEPVTIEQYQVSTRIPADWREAQFGFYNR